MSSYEDHTVLNYKCGFKLYLIFGHCGIYTVCVCVCLCVCVIKLCDSLEQLRKSFSRCVLFLCVHLSPNV